MKAFLQPAFALFFRVQTLTSYGLVSALLLILQFGCFALLLLAARAAGDSWISLSGSMPLPWALSVLGWIVFGFGFYLYVFLGIVNRNAVNSLYRLMTRLGAGDLSLHFLPGWGDASEGQTLWTSLHRMNRTLRHIVQQLRTSAETIANGAREIAHGYADLSQRTETQASTLEETAASMEQLSATVKQNADNCRAANDAVSEVGGQAEEAAHSMQRVTATMARIQASTRQMTEFVGLVEGIAFQTNILALNAAVEAARAGEQGHGFAVVAAEVRALAQRSAHATEEIKALIGASFDKVTDGGKLVLRAEQSVNRAVAGIRQVVERIGTVATASAEQHAGVQGVSKALTELEAVTQHNAALVEEGAAAASAFEQESARLVGVAEVFRLPEGTTMEREITIGNAETARKNYAMGSVLWPLVKPALGLFSQTRFSIQFVFIGVAFLIGPALNLVAAMAVARPDTAGAHFLLASPAGAALLLAAGCSFLAASYLFVSLAMWMTNSTGYMEHMSKKLANGDLAWTIRIDPSPKAARLEATKVNIALAKLHEHFTAIVRQARNSADGIVSGAREIARGYADLSQRTEAQASTLEDTAANMESLSATTQRNADNCRLANAAVEEVGARSEEAAQSMHQVTNTMAGIEESASRMTEFVQIIEGIAFQTNILALNAAVEAARAGDQGRGFAVVAAEVRALAQRSAQATEQIKALIAAASGQVQEGATLVAQAEQAVNRAAGGVRHVMELIGAIATASAEQSAGTQLIGKALMQLETVTQQNAALVEEGVAASASFEQEAARLAEVVRVFRLDRAEKEAARSEPSRAPVPALPALAPSPVVPRAFGAHGGRR